MAEGEMQQIALEVETDKAKPELSLPPLRPPHTNFVMLDSMEETSNVSGLSSTATRGLSLAAVLQLAFQSIGVVYGDLGTSPLYVFNTTFSGWGRDPSHHEIVGALSLIIYSLTLIPLIKYVFIVLQANDSGEGGTFAMYSLICRHCNGRSMAEQLNFSAFNLQVPNKHHKRAEKMKKALERKSWAKTCLLSVALLGTCMVIGDGILTPCISVLSALDGLKGMHAYHFNNKDAIVMISIAILVLLFSIQHFGTDKVGYMFAPALMIWFLLIGLIGIFNFIHHDSSVIKAFNPTYIIQYFTGDPKRAWISLGGIVLCLTGTEAMFADLGHFSVRSIQISFSGVVYPFLICAYIGQAAYLSKFPSHAKEAFYKSIPETVYWPMFVIAVLAAIIASQAMISATFSIVKQSMALGCFPRVHVVHTSRKFEGQVYIPEINYLLMFTCIIITASFQDANKMGCAFGIAVVSVMLVTSSFLVLIMLMIWKTNLLLIAIFISVFMTIELVYFSSVLYKFTEGGYLPLAFSAVLFFVMFVWNYVQTKRYAYEVEKKVSMQNLTKLSSDFGITRVPGVTLLYTELTQGVPSIFFHLLNNLPAVHSVLVFVSVKYLPVNKVLSKERFLLGRVGPKENSMYRCIARYGYRDKRVGHEEFENLLMENLKLFIRMENQVDELEHKVVKFNKDGGDMEEIQFLERSWSAGVVYLLGDSDVKATEDSGPLKKLVVDYAYDLLRRNCRQGFVDLQIPARNLLRVGMRYHI